MTPSMDFSWRDRLAIMAECNSSNDGSHDNNGGFCSWCAEPLTAEAKRMLLLGRNSAQIAREDAKRDAAAKAKAKANPRYIRRQEAARRGHENRKNRGNK